MTKKTAADWSNYWQGRASAETGAALAGVGVEDLPSLNDFWINLFKNAPPEARVLDLACGAGSALKHAADAGIRSLTGADISEGALTALKARLHQVTGVTCSADDTPFDDGAFDFVVSQFGFEYAGAMGAGREAARLVGKGGSFVAVSHYEGGAIEEEVSDRLTRAQSILASGFLDAAIRITTEIYQDNRVSNEGRAAFEGSQPKLTAAIQQDPTGLGRHLYQGFQKMFEGRQAYALEDITGWLGGMKGEIEAFTGRMQSMKEAALSKIDVEALMTLMAEAGLECQPPEPFVLKENSAPGAWVLRATRPQ